MYLINRPIKKTRTMTYSRRIAMTPSAVTRLRSKHVARASALGTPKLLELDEGSKMLSIESSVECKQVKPLTQRKVSHSSSLTESFLRSQAALLHLHSPLATSKAPLSDKKTKDGIPINSFLFVFCPMTFE